MRLCVCLCACACVCVCVWLKVSVTQNLITSVLQIAQPCTFNTLNPSKPIHFLLLHTVHHAEKIVCAHLHTGSVLIESVEQRVEGGHFQGDIHMVAARLGFKCHGWE